tara:strand:+ start:1356 stop:1538 length:183 start_codon:yes stop_codon:yes gene_type:complete
MSETVEVICLLAATFVQCWNTIMKKIPKTTDKICLGETESEALVSRVTDSKARVMAKPIY